MGWVMLCFWVRVGVVFLADEDAWAAVGEAPAVGIA